MNYLLFPRWGDWAVVKVRDKIPENASDALDESVLRAGFLNDEWPFVRAEK